MGLLSDPQLRIFWPILVHSQHFIIVLINFFLSRASLEGWYWRLHGVCSHTNYREYNV